MNLYVIIMVEPRDKVPVGAKAGEEFTLMLGGIPAGETMGPWRREQQEIIESTVTKWVETKPEKATPRHLAQRRHTLKTLENGDYRFTFEFFTTDPINLEAFQKDTSDLFHRLQDACKGTDMVATKFNSI